MYITIHYQPSDPQTDVEVDIALQVAHLVNPWRPDAMEGLVFANIPTDGDQTILTLVQEELRKIDPLTFVATASDSGWSMARSSDILPMSKVNATVSFE